MQVPTGHNHQIHRLRPGDDHWFSQMLALFADAFKDPENYASAPPDAGYRAGLLGRNDIIILVVLRGENVVGALVTYELQKFEQARSEYYIYDLAVAPSCRRQGIATALIDRLREIANGNGVSTIFVQADHGDDPAIALYRKLGRGADVNHFDLLPD